MKKKRIIRLAVVLACIAGLLVAGSMATTVEKTIRVNADYYDVSLQLNNIKNYRAWYPGFTDGTTGTAASAGAGGTVLTDANNRQLSIHALNPSLVMVTETDGETVSVQSISAIPMPNEKQTEVLWSVKMPWYKRISNFFTGRDNIEQGLINLKSTMEDPALRYGFRIELTPVRDSIILTSTRASADSNRTQTLQSLYDTLVAYIARNKPGGAKNYYYVTSNVVTPKKTEFAVGIPVTVASQPDTSISYLHLPSTGRVLTGKGKVGALRELYAAMNRYANDQGLQKVAQELEKYNMEPARLPDHPEEEVELVFPVY
ncbi:MAG: hypothetical protein EOO05_01305 [Chitinophagaceae bacterium]|nr:MAG: hypothetical protein EOO05_01305 [Chitinophagaceae bacterium]